ncbi:MAG: YoaK family protein, partial [Bacillota bacterium]|nr:YoaK family protein [Bacillota bacterium]
GNIVFLAICVSKGEWGQALVYVPPILAFVIGVIIAESIKNNSSRLFILDWVQVVLILEIIILFIIGFLPRTVSDIVVTVTISFVASLQTSSFRKLVDSPYATVMCTGNLLSASRSAYTAFIKKDYRSAIHTIRFFTVILSFLIGAILGGIITPILGAKAIWSAVFILVCAVMFFSVDIRKNTRELA